MTLQILLGFLLGSQLFWFWQVHKLVNKLMSRNYWEYQAAKKPLKHEPAAPLPDDVEEEIEALF